MGCVALALEHFRFQSMRTWCEWNLIRERYNLLEPGNVRTWKTHDSFGTEKNIKPISDSYGTPWSAIRHLTNNSDSSKQDTSSKANHFAYNLLSSMPDGGRTPPCFKGIVSHVICSRYPCYSLVPLVVTAAPLGALKECAPASTARPTQTVWCCHLITTQSYIEPDQCMRSFIERTTTTTTTTGLNLHKLVAKVSPVWCATVWYCPDWFHRIESSAQKSAIGKYRRRARQNYGKFTCDTWNFHRLRGRLTCVRGFGVRPRQIPLNTST